eukprot:scaffold5717_cov112-Isochrysis_galbana.AAC.9
MAPRQLLLELEEVDMAAEKGSKRVRVDRADESSTQRQTSTNLLLTHSFHCLSDGRLLLLRATSINVKGAARCVDAEKREAGRRAHGGGNLFWRRINNNSAHTLHALHALRTTATATNIKWSRLARIDDVEDERVAATGDGKGVEQPMGRGCAGTHAHRRLDAGWNLEIRTTACINMQRSGALMLMLMCQRTHAYR